MPLSKSIKTSIANLSESELKEIIHIAQDMLGALISTSSIKETIKETRFSKGQECPRCYGKNINKNGKTGGRQRYICKNCRRTFDEITLSPFSHSKISLDKWLKYCELLIMGESIRQCAEDIEVCVKTSFYMRHRILDVLNITLKQDVVDGIIEVDETYVRESFKGNHTRGSRFIMPREPRKRGKSKYRGISHEQVCIESAIDRKGNLIIGAVGTGRITTEQIVNFFEGRIGSDVTMCTDSHKSYMSIVKDLPISIKQIPRGKRINGVYHIQHINSLHSTFKTWIRGFNGVATKYLNNYLSWFKFLQLSKKNKKTERISGLLINVATKDTFISIESIKNRYVEYLK